MDTVKPLRIAHLIPTFAYFTETSIVGGASNALYNLATAQANDHQVTIVSHIPAHQAPLRTQHNINLVPLNLKGKQATTAYALRVTIKLALWAYHNRHRFDLIHTHSGFLDYLLAARLAQWVSRKPTLHTLYCPVPAKHRRWHFDPYRALLQYCGLTLTKLVAFSHNIQTSLHRYGITRHDLTVTTPPVDLHRFSPGASLTICRHSLGLEEKNVVLLYVGNTSPVKNLPVVIEAFHLLKQQCPKAHLIITTELAGASPTVEMQAIQQQIERLGLTTNITQIGIIDYMPDLMRLSDVVVAPFTAQVGPSDYFMSVLEAMACAKAVIVSRVGGMPELVDSESGRLVNPTNPTEVAAAMLELTQSPQLRRQLGQNAAKAMQQCRPTTVANQYNQLYQTILYK